jgi:alkylhydroperoxidase family enzyme
MREAMTKLAPAGSQGRAAATRRRPGAANVLGAMAHHPDLAKAFYTFNGHLLNATTLTARQREIIVLRVATVKRSGYEWAQHLFIAEAVGLSEREIAAVAYGSACPLWSELDAALVQSVDDVIDDGGLSEQTWTVLTMHLNTAQILDVIHTIGGYVTLAAVIQSLDLELEADIHEMLKP